MNIDVPDSELSQAERVRRMSEEDRQRFFSTKTNEELAALEWHWPFWARPKQLIPGEGDWRVYILLSGRGWGKSRCGAEWVRQQVERGCKRIAMVAPTSADTRDVMVEGESGILAISPPWNKPHYEPSKRRVVWPNGAVATLYSAEEPERLRGPQHDSAWCDEVAAWRNARDAWDMLMFTMRGGKDPKVVVTTTPKPIPLLRGLIVREDVKVVTGSSYENASNLAPGFLEEIIRKYEGTSLGRQEIYAEILNDVEGALWNRDLLDRCRVKEAPPLIRIAVGVDPAVSAAEGSNETGIIVAGVGEDGHGYVLEDVSVISSPETWSRRVVTCYTARQANYIVAEANNGGDLVEQAIRMHDPTVAYRKVYAAKAKVARAEPIVMLYEQKKIHHVGVFDQLEDQQCTWLPGEKSPDRVDALVWVLSSLMLRNTPHAEPSGPLDGGRWSSFGDQLVGSPWGRF